MMQGLVVLAAVDGVVTLDVADQLKEEGDQGRQAESCRVLEGGVWEPEEAPRRQRVRRLQEQCCLQEDWGWWWRPRQQWQRSHEVLQSRRSLAPVASAGAPPVLRTLLRSTLLSFFPFVITVSSFSLVLQTTSGHPFI
jgi:hypothetical protein